MPLKFNYSAFSKALLDPEMALPEGIVGPDGKPAPKRFGVYRNNVTVSLIEALKATFPAVCSLVGDEFFKMMARTYLRSHPADSAVMLEYGRGFANFISSFTPAQSLPFLGDVARVDRAWLDAYHAADAEPLNPERLSGLSDGQLGKVRFEFHPAAKLIRSDYPIYDLWMAGKNDQANAQIDPGRVQNIAISRPSYEINTFKVSPASGLFIHSLMQGEALGMASELVVNDDNFDLIRILKFLVGSGMFLEMEF